MTLRDDVRDYFEREARRLPAPAGLRLDAAARAGATTSPPRSIRLAAVLAALLAVAIVAVLLAGNELRRVLNPQVTPGGHIRVTSGQTAQVIDFDLVDRNLGWVLAAVCDHNVANGLGNCQAWVVATRDGGHTWVDPAKVGTLFSGYDADGPRHIHFANTSDGFVYGLGVAFVTHDGGRTWTRIPGQTSELIAITGFATVWAVLEPCATGSQCPFAVRASSDGGRTWAAAARFRLDSPPATRPLSERPGCCSPDLATATW